MSHRQDARDEADAEPALMDAYAEGRKDEREEATRIIQDLLRAFTGPKLNDEMISYRATVLARDYVAGNVGWP